MDNELSLLFDSGKTNTKLILFDNKGSILDSISISTPYVSLGDYSHLDSDYIKSWLLDCFEYFSSNISGSQISSLIPITHGACAAVLSKKNLLLPIMDYESNIFEKINCEYDEFVKKLNKAISPKLPLGLNLGRQLYWQSKKYWEIWPSVTDVLTYPQYISWLLTGHKYSEISSISCHTDLWDPFKMTFSSLSVSLNFDKIFPRFNDAFSISGKISSLPFKNKHIKKSCQVYVGGHDSSVAFYGYLGLLRKRKFAIVSSGTWIVVMTNHFNKNKINLLESQNLISNGVDKNLIYSTRFMPRNKANCLQIIDTCDHELDLKDFIFIFNNKFFFIERYKNSLKSMNNFIACQSIHLSLLTLQSLLNIDYFGDIVVEGSYVKDLNYLKALSLFWVKGDVYVNNDQESNMTKGALNLIRRNQSPEFEAALISIKKIEKLNLAYPHDYVNLWHEINIESNS